MRIPREFRDLAKAAKDQGWDLSVTGSGHIRWVNPQGRSVFTPSSPSDHRCIKNVTRTLRDKGLKI